MAMDAARFEVLASAYGADFRRWPAAERDGARAFAEANRAESERLLFEARQIDAALDAAPAPAPTMALRDRVVETAPRPKARREREGWWAWAPGAGLAAACAAGVLVGVAAMDGVTASSNSDTVLVANADSGLSDVDLTELL
jgi:hypothetical protein